MEEPGNVDFRGRIASGLCCLLVLLSVAWMLDVPRYFGRAFHTEQLLALAYGIALATIFITRSANRTPAVRVPWHDAVAAILGLGVMSWVSYEYDRLLTILSARSDETIVIGAIVLLLTLEALRRTAGYLLLIVVATFVLYGFVGHLVPGTLTANYVRPDYLLTYLSLDINAILGTPMRIGTTVVVAFVLLGQLLFKSGGGDFFADLATATTGGTRGGAAKISIVGSALFGTISGSATSNVTSTGIITIPLMRQAGYSGRAAGAIEAVASTGGQLMPPIMGAAAFLMAEFLSIPYTDIVIAAIIPSLLYYFAVFVQVDLLAAKHKLKPVEIEIETTAQIILRGVHFLIPFGVLIVGLFHYNLEPELAAIYALLCVLIGGGLRRYRGTRLSVRGAVDAVSETGAVTIDMLAILAGAGIVIGVLSVTGGGFALTLFLVGLGGGNLFFLLLIAGVICIVLGMGMPTSGVYVLLAALIAPAIAEAGVTPLAAHLFILYFGMLSMITPPIALACFAAAVLTREDPIKTALTAMSFGWVAYIIPFMFVLSPSLMGQGPISFILINSATALFGVFMCSVAITGYFARPLPLIPRVLAVASGAMSIFPGTVMEHGHVIVGVGILLGCVLLGWQKVSGALTVNRSSTGTPP